MNETSEEFIPAIERLDQYVVRKLPSLSRASVAKVIEAGQVEVNGKPRTKPGYKLKTADIVVVHYDELETKAIPKIDLPVLYEDEDCVVIIKPLGMLTHSKGAYNPEATVATWLRERIDIEAFEPAKLTADDAPEIDAAIIAPSNDRMGIVHRLDRATSGVMICAKTPEALSWLQKQFAQRRTKKTYVAVAVGHLEPKEAVIDMAIERNPKKPQTFRVGSNGKAATTVYKVVEESEDYSLIELKPTTGRTHQLRVHLNKLGHPIVGDELYGGKKAARLYLHALHLELTLPNRSRQTFTAPLPAEFKEVMA